MHTHAKRLMLLLAAAAVILAGVVYLVGARATWQALREAGPAAVLLVGAVQALLLAFQAAAWSALERRGERRVRFRTLLAATTVGLAGNILTPSTYLGGEPGRVLYVGRRTGLPYTRLAGSVLLCKYVEAMSFVLLLGVSTAVALVGLRKELFSPQHWPLGVMIPMLAAVALGLGGAAWAGLVRRWTPLTGLVSLVGRLRVRPAFFGRLGQRALRMELHASRMFRGRAGASVEAFTWFLLAHMVMLLRPLGFFLLGWRIGLGPAELGLIFLTSQLLLAFQLVPSGVGTLDGGLLGVVAIAGLSITAPQCAAYLLCLRFWDAVVVAAGAVLAGRVGLGLFRPVARTA